MDVYEGGARLLIRCIPRINLAALALPASERRGFKASRGPRPPQRYFDRQEVEDAASSSGGAEIESRMTRFNLRCDVWGGRYYHDGMEFREARRQGKGWWEGGRRLHNSPRPFGRTPFTSVPFPYVFSLPSLCRSSRGW